MLKWIASGCLVIVLVVAGVMYFGYRKMSDIAAEGPAVTVSIAATPERVFASIANADSLATWRTGLPPVASTRRGMLQVGDTVMERAPNDTVNAPGGWVVTSVVPNQLLVMEIFSTANGNLKAVRRDSIAAAGDSTRVTSAVEITLPDSAQARAQGAPSGVMNAATKMMIAGSRMQVDSELKRLKARLEGTPVSRP